MKTRTYTKNIICIIGLSAFFVFGNASFASATSLVPSPQTSPNVPPKLLEVKDQVQKLIEIKDNISLSDEQKAAQEIEIKKDILLNILTVSQDQFTQAKKDLESISFPQSDEWKSIKENLLSSIDEATTFYKDTQKKITSQTNLTLTDIKETAQAISTKKKTDYDPLLSRTQILISAFTISDILSLADERLSKIQIDVNKIYSQKLTKRSDLKQSLESASKTIKQAHDLNDSSKEIILNTYGETSPTSTEKFIQSLEKDVLQFKIKNKKSLPAEASITAKEKTSTTVTTDDIQDYLSSLTFSSLDLIKKAYDTFLTMSTKVQEYIK